MIIPTAEPEKNRQAKRYTGMLRNTAVTPIKPKSIQNLCPSMPDIPKGCKTSNIRNTTNEEINTTFHL